MKPNLVLSILTILFSLFFLIVTLQIPAAKSTTVVGPVAWPMLILIFMLIMGVYQLIKTVKEHKKGIQDNEETEKDDLPQIQGKVNKGLKGGHWYILIAMALYVFFLPLVGFLIVTPILFLFLAWLLGMRKKITLISVTILSNIIFIFIFIYALNIPFPRGTGIFRNMSLWIY